jgi:hypothetical protein
MEWIVCSACGEDALVRAGGKGYCSRGACRGSAGSRRKGTDHHAWKAGDASYSAMHNRVYRTRGKADHCSKCGLSDPAVTYQWASLTGKLDDPYDYAQMCPKCHRQYDIACLKIGEEHHAAKLTADAVREIRARAASGELGKALSREFGVDPSTVYDIINRKKWKHVA